MLIKNRGTMNVDNEPAIKEILDAINRAGYILEQRICPIIERYGFRALSNQHYKDQDTGKSREIDVIAEKTNYVGNKGIADFDSFDTRLIFECKNNSTPIIFFTRKQYKYDWGIVHISGYPNSILDGNKSYPVSIDEYLGLINFHHNFNVEWVARQYCQIIPTKDKEKRKDDPWTATDEIIYESVLKLAKVTEYYLKSESDKLFHTIYKNHVGLRVTCPVLLFSGKIYECRIVDNEPILTERKHIVFHQMIESEVLKGVFHIDVIHESYLDEFLQLVTHEENMIIEKIQSNIDLLKDNAARNHDEEEREAFFSSANTEKDSDGE